MKTYPKGGINVGKKNAYPFYSIDPCAWVCWIFKKINNLNIGMTKAEVIAAMGEPNYTSAANNVEILSYKLTSTSLVSDTYFVRIKDGKVERFGQQGFGSYY